MQTFFQPRKRNSAKIFEETITNKNILRKHFVAGMVQLIIDAKMFLFIFSPMIFTVLPSVH